MGEALFRLFTQGVFGGEKNGGFIGRNTGKNPKRLKFFRETISSFALTVLEWNQNM
jgi:hypothetical protein